MIDQKTIDRIAEVMGWCVVKAADGRLVYVNDESQYELPNGAWRVRATWNPFTSLDAARYLVEWILEQGNDMLINFNCRLNETTFGVLTLPIHVLQLSPEQITLAFIETVKALGLWEKKP